MQPTAAKALVFILTLAVVALGSQALSGLQLFGMERPGDEAVVTCSGESVRLDGARAELLRLHNEERAAHGAPRSAGARSSPARRPPTRRT